MAALPNFDYFDRSKGKIYVNPNFSMPHVMGNCVLPNSAAMHVNPKFSHLITNVQPAICNKPKIYVNPNFIKSKNKIHNPSAYTTTENKQVIAPIMVKDTNNLKINENNTTIITEIQVKTQPRTVTKSRYTLVRKTTKELEKNNLPLVQSKRTIQINKYKSVQLKDVRHNLETVKSISVKKCGYNVGIPYSSKINITSAKSCETRNIFKLVNHANTSSAATNIMTKPKPMASKVVVGVEKKGLAKFNRSIIRIKKVKKGNLKINNIPCPLFRKFGKCLRSIRGKCEFLHDKKHIRICRKFVKGICHDKECLLSHDLTKQKMPTCHFYLQGTCIKQDCPYLHVKLNANAKVCPDFIKGYCEKGVKCLNRHINVQVQKKVPFQLKKYSKSNDIGRNKAFDHENVIRTRAASAITETELESNVDLTEYRYYQENRNDSNVNEKMYEVIKPTRCKLGTLPSFIQL